MSHETLLRPHHLYRLALDRAGWRPDGSVHSLIKITQSTVEEICKINDAYYLDTIGKGPDKPVTEVNFESGLENNWLMRNRKARQHYLNLTDDDIVKFVTVGKDSICQACAIGQHCLNLDSAHYEHERILSIREHIHELGLGEVVLADDSEISLSYYATVAFGVLRQYMDKGIELTMHLEEGGIMGREISLYSYLYNEDVSL